jgi:hypothetical protein
MTPAGSDDRPDVAEVVASGDPQHVRVVLRGQVRGVGFLTFPPQCLGLPSHGHGIGAADHDADDPVAELTADAGPVVGVLDRVVQQRGVLAAAVLQ